MKIIPYWMVRPSVQFQNQAHIWNPRGTGHILKTICGAAGAPYFFFLFLSPTQRGRRGRPKWFYKCDPFHEDSKYVLGFEIGQRESGFYNERTESQTDVPSSTVLVYRFCMKHLF